MPRPKRQQKKETNALYHKGDILSFYSELGKTNFFLAVVTEDITESDKETPNLTICQESPDNKLHFIAIEEDSQMTKLNNVIQIVENKDMVVELATPLQKKKVVMSSSKGRSKSKGKAVEVKQEIPAKPLTIKLTDKIYKNLRQLAQKFQIQDYSSDGMIEEDLSENLNEDLESESETENQLCGMSNLTKKIKRVICVKSAPKKEVSNHAVLGKRGTKDLDISTSVQSPGAETKAKATKKVKQAVVRKAKAKVVVVKDYKKGHFNTRIEALEHDPQEHPQNPNNPLFDCCIRCNSKELISAVASNNIPLLKKILQSDCKISSLHQTWGIENTNNFFMQIFLQDDLNLITEALLLMRNSSKIKFGSNPVSAIHTANTGFNNASAYGFRTRQVQMSRGGREGMNAFNKDCNNYQNGNEEDLYKRLMEDNRISLKKMKLFYTYGIENCNWETRLLNYLQRCI